MEVWAYLVILELELGMIDEYQLSRKWENVDIFKSLTFLVFHCLKTLTQWLTAILLEFAFHKNPIVKGHLFSIPSLYRIK